MLHLLLLMGFDALDPFVFVNCRNINHTFTGLDMAGAGEVRQATLPVKWLSFVIS